MNILLQEESGANPISLPKSHPANANIVTLYAKEASLQHKVILSK